MEKPLALRKADFCKGLVELINGSGLPAFVIADVIRDLSEKTTALAQQELEKQTEAYYRALHDEEKGANTEASEEETLEEDVSEDDLR